MSRLSFLSEEILTGLRTRVGCPEVNRAGESSIPGLYFAGAHTMASLGPGVRFIAGTHYTVAQLAKSVARRARRGRGTARPAEDPAAAAAEPLTARTGPGPAV